MEPRDTKAILKAIKKAQEPARDLFQQKPPLVLTKEEEETVSNVKQAIAQNRPIGYLEGNRLMSIFRRAY